MITVFLTIQIIIDITVLVMFYRYTKLTDSISDITKATAIHIAKQEAVNEVEMQIIKGIEQAITDTFPNRENKDDEENLN